MMMSGLVLNDDVKWVSFHSSYDFGYLLKTLTCKELPMEESAFLELLHTYFPYIYDVKYMMTAVEGMYGGLSALADTLQVDRIGPMHQAGSDSLLTAQTFFSLINKHFQGACDDSKFRGELFGLGSNHTKYKGKGYNEGGGGGGGNGSSNGNGNGNGGLEQPMAYSGQVRPGCYCTFDALCRPPIF
jgi:CCR4-NOT transcription complex subunit 7/8